MSQFVGLLGALAKLRRAHSLEVGRKVESVAHNVNEAWREDLVAAAYLHDIGYAHPCTGLHAIDGAAFLKDQGFSPLVCHLVAYHSCSPIEAEVRGLTAELYLPFSYPNVEPDLHRIVCWADMTTGPTGATVTVDERLNEILERYGPDDVVSQFIHRARPLLQRMAQAPSSGSM